MKEKSNSLQRLVSFVCIMLLFAVSALASETTQRATEITWVDVELVKNMFAIDGVTDVRYLVYWIVALVAVLYGMMCANIKSLYIAIMFVAVSIAELFYCANEPDFAWFCKEPRWWWIAINFLIFSAAMIGQMISLHAFAKRQSNGWGFLTFWSLPAAYLAAWVCIIVNEELLKWVFPVYCLCQIIQAGLIFKGSVESDGVPLALFYAIVYLVAMIATLYVLYEFIVILFVVVLGYIVIYFGAKGTKWILTPEVYRVKDGGTTYILKGSGIYFTDQFGHEWEKIGTNNFVRK